MSKVKLSQISNPEEVTIFDFASNGALGLGGANYGNSGEVVTSQGSTSTPTWTSIGPNTILYTSSGIYVPTSGKTSILVYCIGGGGSVVNGTYGGGCGGCAWRIYTPAQIGSSASITIGSAGTPAGQSQFIPSGSTLSLTGGGANQAATLIFGTSISIWFPNVTYTSSGGSSTGSTLTQWVGSPGSGGYEGAPGIFGIGNGATYGGAAATNGGVIIHEF